MQWPWHLGGYEIVPLPGNARIQMGIYQRHSNHIGQDQTSCIAVHTRVVDTRSLAWSIFFLHALPRRLPVGVFLANHRVEHVFSQTHFWTSSKSYAQSMATRCYWSDCRSFCQVNINLFLSNFKLVNFLFQIFNRQYYTYVTDARCTRVGTQCWVFGAILFTELIICIKFGKEIFEHTQILTIALWLGIQSIMSMICLYGCVLYHRHEVKKVWNPKTRNLTTWQWNQSILFHRLWKEMWRPIPFVNPS